MHVYMCSILIRIYALGMQHSLRGTNEICLCAERAMPSMYMSPILLEVCFRMHMYRELEAMYKAYS